MTSPKDLSNLSPAEKKKLLAELLKKSGGTAPKIYPLASGQKALWLLHQQAPDSAAYNTPFALRLRSVVDVPALKKSFETLAARHPCLRTTFSATPDGQLLQTVHQSLAPQFREVSAAGFSDEVLYEEVVRAYREPFSLEKGPLFRGVLFTRGAEDHVLLIVIHHIVYDAWSAQIIQRELSQTYITLSKGGQVAMSPVIGSYQDFVAKQAEQLAGPVGRSHYEYWEKKLSGELPLLALPSDRARSPKGSNQSGSATFRLDAGLTQKIKELASSVGATPFAVLVSAYGALLSRLAGQDEVLIGSPTAGRPGVEAHDVVGYYSNPVVLRADLTKNPTSRALIAQMKDVVLEALGHQDFPFASLVERLDIPRKPGVSPIFQASISLQSSQEGAEAMELWATPEEGARLRWGHIELEPYPIKDIEGQFDLTLEMWEARGTFAGLLRYSRDLFDDSTVALWRKYFAQILEAMVKTPDLEIGRLQLAEATTANTSAPPAQPLKTFRAPTINAMFAEQVARAPEATALVFGESRLSYAELDARANVLAWELKARGVGPESLVGVCVDRNLELIVSILGILKAGGAYVPLDPTSPKDRLGMILEDAEVVALLTETKRAAELPTDKVPTIYVDSVKWAEGKRSPLMLDGLSPESAAYVIYTSGSTGKPKGVIVTHANVTRLMTCTEGLYSFGPTDAWTVFHSASFDFSVWEIWGALLYGGRLVVVPYWMSRSPEAFAELINKEGVTVLNQTPSAFRALLRAPGMQTAEGGKTLRYIIFGGEALDAATVRPWFERHPGGTTQLVNMYGITETTVHVTYHLVSLSELQSSQSLIGVPIPDLTMELLDAHGQPVPVGVPGEIYVGGAGVARGYLKRPELTAQRFLPDPKNPGKKLYRSGDLAMRLPDGSYSYLGRMDHQVKIRGFRIELGEIQSVIADHPAVGEAFVMTYDRSEDDRRLVAYVVPKANAADTLLAAPAEASTDAEKKDTHVNEWQELYNELYARSAADSSTDYNFNIAGWNSSYSGAPLSAEAMKEWVDHTVAQVLEKKPQRVLEIGCGSGLLLTRIAPKTSAYWACDVSNVVVDMLKAYTKKTPALAHAKLFTSPGDEIEQRVDFGDQKFDCVIINSVIQYFPSGEYLAKVLETAAKYVAPGGFIFAGDIRNLRLLEAFHASILLAQSSGTIDPKGFKEKVARRLAGEEELVLDPDFFWTLKSRIPRLSHVEVRPKRGAAQNELTRFRYDVLLHLEAPARPADDVVWGPGSVGLLELREKLGNIGSTRLGLRGIRNARVQAPNETTAWLTGTGAAPDRGAVEKLRRRVLDRDGSSAAQDVEPGLDPEALFKLAEAMGLDVVLDWSRGGADGAFDAVFGPKFPHDAPPVAWFGTPPPPKASATLANDPLRGKVERKLESELKRRAQDRLPDYMVPSSIMIVDKIPLTDNGKVDRRALPPPTTQEAATEYVEPRTGEEEILASVFAELLGAERVGVKDSFFDLGGHSLLATQVVSRIRSVFGVDLPLRALFDNPTVGGLAQAVSALHRGTGQTPVAELSAPQERPENIPLSSSQERMWILDRVEETRSPIYVIPLVLRLRGAIDEPALKKAIGAIVSRHEALRTSFPTSGELPMQWVVEDAGIELPPVEVLHFAPGSSEKEQEKQIQDAVGMEVSRPFDLARGPVLRLRLFRVLESDHIFVMTMHHIVSDGWSVGVLCRELATAYNAYHSGREPVLPALPIQYADFAIWQRKAEESQGLKESIQTCQKRLAGAPPFLDIPADRPRPPTPSWKGGVVRFNLDRGLTTRLKDLSRREGATLYMTLLSAFSTYLSRITGQKDLVIGSPVANRNRAATEPLIGLFVNTLALRVNLAGDPTFLELLARVRKTTLDAYADQDVPFEKLVEAVSPERSLNRQPLVQAMFVLQNAPFVAPSLDGVTVEMLELDSITSKFDLTLSMQETVDGLSALFEYSAELFDKERIERMVKHFSSILEGVVKEPKRHLQALPVFDDTEQKALEKWGQGGPALIAEGTLPALIERQRLERPSAPALVIDGNPISYEALDQRATALAEELVELGVGPDKLVAIALPRSAELYVAILGIWKAGGAYVPIDPDYPEARIQHMLDDSKVEIVLSTHAVKAAAGMKKKLLWLDETRPKANKPPALSPPKPGQLAYVIYTSGSTGKPKGVLVEHRGLANIAAIQQKQLGLDPDSAVLSFASPSFDASAWELSMALANGGRLVISTSEAARAGVELADLLEKQGVTHATLPPSTLAALPGDRAYSKLKVVISAGEACTIELAKKWTTAARRFVNAYGPTESTICTTMGEIRADDAKVTIGGPLPGLIVKILDADRRPVPIGVPGELCVAGIGVARGYLNREELTRERFIELGNERYYTTGDLVRFGTDGRIEYLGRIDHQVKLRGYRIELGEIETVLESHPEVQQALANVHKNQLVAYIVPRAGKKPSAASLREQAALKLPDYMVPTQVMLIDAFPLTPNGKVDRAKLPRPEDAQEKTAYVAADAPVEQILAEIWSEVLKKSPIGVNDNFFALGGDSILGLSIIAKATQRGIRLRPRQLFQHQTIAELAKVAQAGGAATAEQGLVEGSAPLTAIQRWFFDQRRTGAAQYNMALLVEVDPKTDAAILEKALRAMEAHHDALRFRYREEGGAWVQSHVAPSGIPLSVLSLAAPTEIPSALTKLHESLDLAKGPIARAALIHLGSGGARLGLIVHHLAVDAVSFGPLLEDLLVAYAAIAGGTAPKLQPKTTAFKQWAERIVSYAETQAAKAELDGWLAGADREVKVELPLGDPKASDTVADASTISSWLPKAEMEALFTEVAKAYDVKPNELLITALARAIAAWSGGGGARLDIEGHGREFLFEDLDVSRTVGWFTALYPFGVKVNAKDTPRDTLARVKDGLRKVPQGGVGFGVLRWLSQDESVRSRLAALPKAQVAFNFLGQLGKIPAAGIAIGPAKEGLGALHAGASQRTHRLEVNAVITEEGLRTNWTFGSEVFTTETIERLGAAYLSNLRALAEASKTPAAAVRVGADFPAARLSNKDLQKVLNRKK
ncbi:MAG: amino acid adenylation domain-containing protein [Myxococcota bacterium]